VPSDADAGIYSGILEVDCGKKFRLCINLTIQIIYYHHLQNGNMILICGRVLTRLLKSTM
jgi:hypothetical protein